MEVLLAFALIETFLISAVTELEKKRRIYWVRKWISGNITLEEIRLLKRQPWFQKAFKQVSAPPEKKND
jgi:hypothetical protein